MALTQITSAGVKDGELVNADLHSAAAIALSKLGTSGSAGSGNFLRGDGAWTAIDLSSKLSLTGGTLTGDLAISNSQPTITFTDTGHNPDYMIRNADGGLIFNDLTNSTNRLVINPDGHVDVIGNLDVGAGLDVTGNITATGTVDGVDIAARNTLFGGLTSSSGVLTNGVTATTQSASDNSTKVATTAYTDTAISNLVDSSPSTLNTLNELAAALGDDANFSTTITNSIATKAVLSGSTNNTICTVTGANAIQGEANLTFDGTNLGIGTTSPGDTLHINHASDPAIRLHYGSNSGYSVIKVDSVNQLELDVDPTGGATSRHCLIKVGGSEKFRFNGNTSIGIGGANYGTAGQVLTSGGASGAVSWTTVGGTTINNNANNRIITGSGTANTLEGESQLTFDGTTLKVFGAEGGNANVQLIADEGDDNADYWLTQATTGGKYRVLNYADGGWESNIECTGSAGVKLYFNNSEKLEASNTGINVSGSVTPSSGIYLGGSGGGNWLNDYETGTHTVTQVGSGGGVGLSNNVARYTKIGNICQISGMIDVGAASGSSSVEFSLPFTSKADSGSTRTRTVGALMYKNCNMELKTTVGYIGQNENYWRIYDVGDNEGWQQFLSGDFSANNSEMFYTFVYQCA